MTTERDTEIAKAAEAIAAQALRTIEDEAAFADEYLDHLPEDQHPTPAELASLATQALRRILEAPADPRDKAVWRVTLADLDAVAGRQVTEQELPALAGSIRAACAAEVAVWVKHHLDDATLGKDRT